MLRSCCRRDRAGAKEKLSVINYHHGRMLRRRHFLDSVVCAIRNRTACIHIVRINVTDGDLAICYSGGESCFSEITLRIMGGRNATFAPPHKLLEGPKKTWHDNFNASGYTYLSQLIYVAAPLGGRDFHVFRFFSFIVGREDTFAPRHFHWVGNRSRRPPIISIPD